MMFGSSHGTAVGMFWEGVGAAAERADDKGGRTSAAVDVVAESVASSTLGERGTTYKGLDGANVDTVEGRRAALHHFEAGAVGVVEGKDNAGRVFSWWEVSRVSEPSGLEEDFTTVADGVTGKFSCEVSRGRDRAVRVATDRHATEDDVAEASNRDAAGAGAEREAEDIVEDRDVLR